MGPLEKWTQRPVYGLAWLITRSALTVAAGAGPGCQEDCTGRLVGQVELPMGEIATLTLTEVTGYAPAQVTETDDGSFAFEEVKLGRYQIDAELGSCEGLWARSEERLDVECDRVVSTGDFVYYSGCEHD